MSQKTKDPYKQVALKILKIAYSFVVVIAFMVVVFFLLFKVIIRPPEVDGTVEVTLPPSSSTGNQNPSQGVGSGSGQDTPPDVTPEVIQLERKEDFYTFLVLGTDDGNGNADTIMVGAYDVKNGKVSVLSIPRDTMVNVSRNIKKINAGYGYGGVEQVMDEVSDLLGFRPDHYVKVDIQGFKAVVDQLGGVSFYVPEDMYHNDGAGFIIDLKEGTQWLDGEQALQLVRYRGYMNADLGRIQTQQKFLKELGKQLISRSTVSDIDDYAKILNTYLVTDLSLTELAWFGTQALSLDLSTDITFSTLPGDGSAKYQGISTYYELYPEQSYNIINSTVNPYTTAIPADLMDIYQIP